MYDNGNQSSVMNASYGGEGVTLKVWTQDEVGRFMSVSTMALSTRDVERLLEGITARRVELENPQFEF